MKNWKMFWSGLVMSLIALMIELVSLVYAFSGRTSNMITLGGALLGGIGIYICLRGVYDWGGKA